MKKQFGLGSISLILLILVMLWSVNTSGLNNNCIGDFILRFLHLPTWTKGNPRTHFTVFYAFIFIIPAIVLGYKFPNHRYAKVGKMGSILWLCMLITSVIFVANWI